MLRTRLVSFALGFSVAGAAISHFVWRDLWADRHSLSSDMKERFDILEARVSNLESLAIIKSETDES
uniref:Uncharacterized protein n=1 Tax=Nelumbo nucifera TaxID=4432 RepID=A0A822ZK87_NELNU|nr:TPA_asm: hypothetical protein HUJ06_001656 [Nelumbo nucifera]